MIADKPLKEVFKLNVSQNTVKFKKSNQITFRHNTYESIKKKFIKIKRIERVVK